MSEDSYGHRLTGAVEKFNRSSEQFDELIAEMDAFFNAKPKPHTSVGKFDTDKWEWVERFKVIKEPPTRLGVILGDVLHNLRSALDNMIWQVTLLDGGTPDDTTQYPIASKSEDQFEAMANHRIPGLSDKHRAMVKKTQPYRRGDLADRHSLSILATLSNIDKHQIVHPTFSFIEDSGKALDELERTLRGSPITYIWMAKTGSRMKNGTPWLRLGWPRREEPPGEVKVGGDVPLGIAFSEIGVDASEFRKLGEDVWTVIEAFMREFPETRYTDE